MSSDRSRPPSGAAGDLRSASVKRHLREHVWLLAALAVGCLVSATYLLTHPYPSYGAGMFLQIASEISANGYRLPERIHLYTGGLPLAYPPLMMYLAAAVRDLTGVGPIAYSRFLPAIVTVAYLIPYYFIGFELLESRRRAGLATALLAVTPETLQWHLSAGGIVRGPAFLLSLCGIYVGIRLFRSGRPTWIIPGVLLFGLTILSHPVYPVFFGLSWLLLFVAFDRSPRGLLAGAAVAGGGVLFAAPWWTKVAQRHGPDIFFAAAGTHSGLAGGVGRVLSQFVYPIDATLTALFYLAAFAATAYFLRERRFFLPAWMVLSAYVLGKNRFLFVAGAMMMAVALVELVEPWARRSDAVFGDRETSLHPDGGVRRVRASRRFTTVIVAVVACATLVGVLFVGGALPNAHAGSPSQPAFMDAHDEAAMQWVEANTELGSEFVVAGDQAEWFPLLTDRAIQVGPWGVEWTTPERYDHQLGLFRDVSTCATAECVTTTLSGEADPDYVYVPKGEYTVRGYRTSQSNLMRPSLVASDDYRLVFENEGAMIFRVGDGALDA